jgi:xanthine dehydrogenase accessory factor
MSVWPTIARFIAEHGAAALVTMATVEGSSPREPGARMVVAPNGSFTGTIGGGALEWGALAEAQGLMARRDGAAVLRLDRALGPDLGQCCGGFVRLTIERFSQADSDAVATLAEAERAGALVTVAAAGEDGRPVRRIASPDEAAGLPAGQGYLPQGGIVLERFGEEPTAFWLFGAGHVGRALAVALAPLPFAVTWIDTRPGAIPETFPGNVTAVRHGDPVELLARAPDGAFIAVMTHSHALDLDLVIAALRAGRFAYVGLIGSATKRARFTSAMRKIGIPADAVDSLVCPIGLTAIRDKAPAAIAASVVAQVLIEREKMTRSVNPQGIEQLTPTRRASRADLPLSGGGKGARRG